MTIFESKISISRPITEIYTFLADLNNHQQLMPESVINWKSTAATASFEIQNMTKLSLKIETLVMDQQIIIVPSDKAPFDLELKWSFTTDDGYTEVLFTIAAQLNMMMKMLASGPLQKLADHETQSLSAIFN